MDLWKCFDLGHRDHAILNPTSPTRLDELIELLDLPGGGRVLDIACGKAEPLVRIAEGIWGGYRKALRALARFAKPGGLVLSGEPYWRREPDPAYLVALGGLERAIFADHAGNVSIGIEEGLTPLYTAVSSEADFDRYEALQWRALERHAAAHPDDPDVPTLLARSRAQRDAYLRWGRDTLGWAMYLFAVQRGV